MMGYLYLGLIALVLFFGVRTYNKIEREAKVAGFQEAARQIGKTNAEQEKDTARETAALLAKRPARIAATQAKQTKRIQDVTAKVQSAPAFNGGCAALPVPELLYDELLANASPAGGIRGDASDREPRPAVQAGGSVTARIHEAYDALRLRAGGAGLRDAAPR